MAIFFSLSPKNFVGDKRQPEVCQRNVDKKNMETKLICQRNTNRNFIFTGPMTRHRIARTIVRKYTPCKNTDTLEYIAKCMDAKWDLSCKMQSHNCYYMVTCKNQKPKKSSWKCTKLHLRNSFPVCCNLICPLKKGRKGR